MAVLILWTYYPVLRVQWTEQRKKARLEAELEALKDRNTELRAEVDRLHTPAGVEEIARSTLGYVRAGEKAYVVTEATSTASAPATTSVPQTGPGPVPAWMRALDLLFGVGD